MSSLITIILIILPLLIMAIILDSHLNNTKTCKINVTIVFESPESEALVYTDVLGFPTKQIKNKELRQVLKLIKADILNAEIKVNKFYESKESAIQNKGIDNKFPPSKDGYPKYKIGDNTGE